MSNELEKTTQKIIAELEALSNPDKAQKMMRYFKTGKGEYAEGDIFWGVAVPVQRKIAQKHKQLPLGELSKLVRHPVHDVRHLALCLLVYKAEKASASELEEYAKFYLNHLIHINNWDLVDVSCRFILGKYLEHRDRSLLYELARSENVWERRISIITCMHFIKNHDFDDALRISDILINDNHDMVQKAVGWMIREIGNLDFEVEFAFLSEGDRYKKMPRTMLRYAIEKYEPTMRQHFLKGTV